MQDGGVSPARPLGRALLGLLLGVLACGRARPDSPSADSVWPDTYAARLTAQASLESLNAELLSHDSASVTLAHWCERHHLASDPRIVAVRVPPDSKPITYELRSLLQVGPRKVIRYRHVQLKCGERVLSEADNWYVPARLSSAMNHLLDTTDTPFGVIVRDTHYQRHTLSARMLWTPLPAGRDMQGAPAGQGNDPLVMPYAVLEHRAVLKLPDGTPFSALVETYTSGVLAFPLPQGQ
jgi:hypothetical protein